MNPVKFYLGKGWRVTSPYGSRVDPITKQPGVFHHGTDFGGKPQGEPVHTPFAGTVRASGYYGAAGNAVAIKSAKTGLVFCFFHLHSRAVTVGQKVTAGQLIGKNGSTGNSTGPHIHFEIRHDKGALFGSSRPAWGDPAKYEEVDEVKKEEPPKPKPEPIPEPVVPVPDPTPEPKPEPIPEPAPEPPPQKEVAPRPSVADWSDVGTNKKLKR